MYCIMETGIDVEIKKKKYAGDYEGFYLNADDCLVPRSAPSVVESALLDLPLCKPRLFYLQHADDPNVEVSAYPLRTHDVPIAYLSRSGGTLCTRIHGR